MLHSFLNYFFCWDIVYLQCCTSFKHMAQWFNYTYICVCVYFFLHSLPLYVLTEYHVEFPVLYSRSLLVIYLYMKVKVKSLSDVRLFATPWTVAYQSPHSMEFSRQEYRSGLPFPSPTQGLNLGLPHCRQMLYLLSHQGSPPLRRYHI